MPPLRRSHVTAAELAGDLVVMNDDLAEAMEEAEMASAEEDEDDEWIN